MRENIDGQLMAVQIKSGRVVAVQYYGYDPEDNGVYYAIKPVGRGTRVSISESYIEEAGLWPERGYIISEDGSEIRYYAQSIYDDGEKYGIKKYPSQSIMSNDIEDGYYVTFGGWFQQEDSSYIPFAWLVPVLGFYTFEDDTDQFRRQALRAIKAGGSKKDSDRLQEEVNDPNFRVSKLPNGQESNLCLKIRNGYENFPYLFGKDDTSCDTADALILLSYKEDWWEEASMFTLALS